MTLPKDFTEHSMTVLYPLFADVVLTLGVEIAQYYIEQIERISVSYPTPDFTSDWSSHMRLLDSIENMLP